MDECCLVFEECYENGVDSSSGSFLRKRTASKKVITYTTQNGGSPITAEGMEVLKEIEREMEERKLMEKSFNQMTKELMKLKGFTKERLAEETGLSVETITKMRCNPNMYFSIQTVAAVCIAMHLSPEMRKVYIDKSPAKFLENLEMNLYRYALAKWSDLSVAEVNRKLIEYGGKPLTNLVEGLDCDIFAITG
jgi:transcriptional regulator with XRE-family HTH domain